MTAETARPARTDWALPGLALADLKIGRASCRERV